MNPFEKTLPVNEEYGRNILIQIKNQGTKAKNMLEISERKL